MKCSFRKSFARDLKSIKSNELLTRVQAIIEAAEAATTIQDLDVKKLAGTNDCYRIRVGDYRLGIVIAKDQMEFVRCLHRRDIYRYFP